MNFEGDVLASFLPKTFSPTPTQSKAALRKYLISGRQSSRLSFCIHITPQPPTVKTARALKIINLFSLLYGALVFQRAGLMLTSVVWMHSLGLVGRSRPPALRKLGYANGRKSLVSLLPFLREWFSGCCFFSFAKPCRTFLSKAV